MMTMTDGMVERQSGVAMTRKGSEGAITMKTKITEGLTMIMKKKELERQQGRTKEVANNDEIAMMEKARKENEGDVMGLGNIFIVSVDYVQHNCVIAIIVFGIASN